MAYAHYINASLVENHATCVNGAPYWRVDAAMSGDETIRDRAYRWANSAKDDAGNGPETVVLELTDGDEAAAIYKAKYLTLREVALLRAGVMVAA